MSDTIGLFHGENSNFGFEVEPPTRCKVGEQNFFFWVIGNFFFQLYNKGKSDIWNFSVKKLNGFESQLKTI